ncbi:urokinase plasminogen activator surface receptor-like isoform X7 [Ctenopharyngodon idella]|uniref:urokinase plasminogen activator surface receptor-like isoform X6 n=1 Tax=Ctenopharyngodon idella TaxID=7959 RepID=UPI002230BA9A|nr:urokinase plasminogen activator surface receptor-like isoform X6 [Ctenopharyngodon idella]XP_051733838.1 urokinase plasminogen activator surface receptor-like isoform X7 [Ctenopharyngodon idella]
MDLQISVFLLFILFTAGHSLRCYECMNVVSSCADQKVNTCPSGSSQCMSTTRVTKDGSKNKYKSCVPQCQSGFVNIGTAKSTVTCCNTDECNVQDAPDRSSNVPNGKKCYYCDGESCTNTVSCSGTENYCIHVIETFGNQSVVSKGCVSKSFCENTAQGPRVQNISCCEGNLCNGAQSVSQSFLFLCCSLLSYFQLH